MPARLDDFHDGVSPAVVRSLRDRIDLLEEQNRQLREAAEQVAWFPEAWKLTRYEARFLSTLVRARAGRMSSERLLTAMYGLEPEVQSKIVDVWACKLRKKLALAGTGIEIKTFWGEGYGLSAADIGTLRAILDGEPSAKARQEREIQGAIAQETAELEARIRALRAENDRLQAGAAPAHRPVEPKAEPAWKRYAKPEKARIGSKWTRGSSGGRR